MPATPYGHMAHVYGTVTGEPVIDVKVGVNRSIRVQPWRVEVNYNAESDAWAVIQITVIGPRILKNGQRGTKRGAKHAMAVYNHTRLNLAPQWARDFAEASRLNLFPVDAKPDDGPHD